MKKDQKPTGVGGRWAVVIVVLIFLMLISFVSSLVIGLLAGTSDIEESGNVAHIKVVGPIYASPSSGLMSADSASSTDIVELIEKAAENDDVEAILVEINSPGGTGVASYEIAAALQESNKTTVAWIREVGASGAYWIASACNHVVANPMTITGSIGVIGSYVEFGGTLNKYNASYRRLVSGEYKDMGSPLRSMTSDEEELMQEALDMMREMFVSGVATNRGLDKDAVDSVADGRIYLGAQALELGLVDELGGKKEAVSWIEKELDIEADISEYEKPKTFAEMLAGIFGSHGFLMGAGLGSSMKVEEGWSVRT
jgi:protease-4